MGLFFSPSFCYAGKNMSVFLRLQQKIDQLKPYILPRKQVILRIVLFAAAFFVYRYLRSWYTQTQYGYTMQGGDSINRYAPYMIIVACIMLYSEKLVNNTLGKERILHRPQYFIGAIILALIPATFFTSQQSLLYLTEIGIELLVATGLFFGIVGTYFYKKFQQEIQVATIMTVMLQLSAVIVDQYWHVFSKITIFALRGLLPLMGQSYTIESATYLVTVADFTVLIGPACAGLGFLTGYTVLFIFAVSLTVQQGKRIHPYKTSAVYLIGLACMFLLNSIRVFLILAVGVFYSEEFAMQLFHNGIGAVLFLLFFFFFTRVILKNISEEGSGFKSNKLDK